MFYQKIIMLTSMLIAEGHRLSCSYHCSRNLHMLCPKKIANHENVVVIPVVVMTVTLWIKFAEPESRKEKHGVIPYLACLRYHSHLPMGVIQSS